MEEELNEENIEKIENKKHTVSKNTLCVRILAAILAFLMVASLVATVASYFIGK